jgi:hypothetical protein
MGTASLDGFHTHTGVEGSLTGRARPLFSTASSTTNSIGAESSQSLRVALADALDEARS